MNQQIEERIKIIRQFKSTLTGKDQSFEKRIKRSKLWGLMNFGLANLLLIFLIVISASTLLHLEPFGQNWHNSGLIVLMTMSLSLHAHFSFVEFLLLKHIKNLSKFNYTFESKSNIELNNLVNDMNYHRFKPYWVIFPTLLIFIGGIFMLLELNPYWNMFPFPVLIISILLSLRLNNYVFLVRRNIENIESKMILNW